MTFPAGGEIKWYTSLKNGLVSFNIIYFLLSTCYHRTSMNCCKPLNIVSCFPEGSVKQGRVFSFAHRHIAGQNVVCV